MTKLRVGIYLRLSNEDKLKNDESESIKNQRKMLMDYIDKNDSLVFKDEYSDENLSGAGTYRPEFERLIGDCEKGLIDVVLCKSQSRFSRDMEIVEKYLNNKFKEWNVRFIGVSDNTDTANNGNKKARQITGLVNEWFLEDVSENIRSAFKAKMNSGEFISPFAPYGYMISSSDNNKLIVDEEASLVVKKIFHLYLKGFGYKEIVKYLNDQNIDSPSLYKYKHGCRLNVVSQRPRELIKWNLNAVKTILNNEVYIGNLVQGKRTTVSYKNHKIVKRDKKDWITVPNTHKAIITNKVFNKVQEEIRTRTRVSSKNTIVHPFSHKVYCGLCNKSMRKKNSSKHQYLVCENPNCRNRHSIRYDVLEELILGNVNELCERYCDKFFITKAVNRQLNEQNKEHSKNITHLKEQYERKLSLTLKCLKDVYYDRTTGLINEDQFQMLLNEYNKDIDDIKKYLHHLNDELNLNGEKEIVLDNILPFNKLTRVIVQEFIQKIIVGELIQDSRKIFIKWNL